MKSLKESILSRDLVDDYKLTITDGDLEYVFDGDIGIGYSEPGQIIYNQLIKHNNISEIEAANLVHQYVEDDKILHKKGFSRKPKSSIKFPGDLNKIINYFSRTFDNSKGYCVVFNPNSHSNISTKPWGVFSNNIFLVCKVRKRYGVSLNAVEWVCDERFQEIISRNWPNSDVHHTESVEESIKYIEKKYGRL